MTKEKREQPMSHPVTREWLTPAEAAEYLGVPTRRIYRACRMLGLKHIRLGKAMKSSMAIRRNWIEEWAEARAIVRDDGQQPWGRR